MKQVLIIEDDLEIASMLVQFLSKNGYGVVTADNGLQGLQQAKEGCYDLVLLDLMLPYKSGDELLRALREVSTVPVLVLSAKTLTQTKIELLQLGADDYITKPFDLYELLARMEVHLRRTDKTTAPATLRHGELTLDIQAKQVQVKGIPLALTAKEFSLLQLMMQTPDKVFSKQNLYESVWQEAYAYDDNTINTHISNLRKKIKEAGQVDYIETVWGMGYRLAKL